jgi:hypothetical protein
MANVFRLGAMCGAAVVALAACSSTPNSAGDDGGISINGDGDFVGSAEGGSNSDSAFGGSGSSSGFSGSSSGTRGGSNSGSSGAGGSSSGVGKGGDGGCPASCARLKRCCPMLAMVDAGALVAGCMSIAASCNQAQCDLAVGMSIGGQTCPM